MVNFGLFDLLGLQLSPRIRDLGKITLYRAGSRTQVEANYPHTGPLLTRKLNTDLIAEHYDDLLRLAGSLKFGHASASLLVGKLSASGRQNALAAALKEYGALRRTIYAARYLSDPVYRRKISRQLNKGESLHALKRDLLYAHEGTVRARHLEQQTEQAWCLTLVTNAVVAWTTEYFGLAVDSMRAAGRRVDDEVLAHISPAHSENINFFGSIDGTSRASWPNSARPAIDRCACATPCSDPDRRETIRRTAEGTGSSPRMRPGRCVVRWCSGAADPLGGRRVRQIKADAPHCRVILTVYEMKRPRLRRADRGGRPDHRARHRSGDARRTADRDLRPHRHRSHPVRVLRRDGRDRRENIREPPSKDSPPQPARETTAAARRSSPPTCCTPFSGAARNGESVGQIRPDLIIPTGKRRDQHPQPGQHLPGACRAPQGAGVRRGHRPSHADFAALQAST